MEILGETIERELPDLARQGVRTRFLGRRDRAPGDLRERWASSSARPATSTRSPSGSRSTTAAAPSSSRRRGAASRTGSTPTTLDEAALAARLYAPELPEIDLLIRTSGEYRISNFMLWETAYAELVFTDTLWPDFGSRRPARRARHVLRAGAEVRRQVSPFWSRHRRRARAAAARPRDRLAGRLVALRRRARRRADGPARALRDGARPAADRPRRLRRAAAHAPRSRAGRDARGWSRGIFATVLVAFVVYGFSDARPSATAAISLTLLGVVWVGGGLGTLMLLRGIPDNGRLAIFTVLIAVFADDTAAYFVGRTIGRHKLAPRSHRGSPGRGSSAGRSRRWPSPSSPCTTRAT